MTTTNNRFNPQQLCSRTLWDLVNATSNNLRMNEAELHEAISELAERRHYLAELEQLGKLEP